MKRVVLDDNNNKEPKERILEVAALLISQKGFAAVGVREIASKADVNISMISYYFGSKVGILKAIIDEYFQNLRAIMKEVIEKELPKESLAREIIANIVALARKKPHMCKVAFYEMPFDIPEIIDFKIQMIAGNIQYIRNSFHSYKTNMALDYQHDFTDYVAEVSEKMRKNEKVKITDKRELMNVIIGPALMSMIFSNFMVSHILPKAFNIDLDDEFYELYIDTISTLFLKGMKGISEEMKLPNNCFNTEQNT